MPPLLALHTRQRRRHRLLFVMSPFAASRAKMRDEAEIVAIAQLAVAHVYCALHAVCLSTLPRLQRNARNGSVDRQREGIYV